MSEKYLQEEVTLLEADRDSCNSQLVFNENIIAEKTIQIDTLESIITDRKQQIANSDTIIANKDVQITKLERHRVGLGVLTLIVTILALF